jgi:hypothetical protein
MDRKFGTPTALYNGRIVSFLGVEWPVCGVERSIASISKVKKEYSYTYTPLVGFRGLF